MQPATIPEKMAEYMDDMLKSIAAARKNHIMLNNVPYGKDLSTELLTFAQEMEQLFKDMQAAKDAKNEKKMAQLLAEAEVKEAQGEKAKAWWGIEEFYVHITNMFHPSNVYKYLFP